MRWSSAVFAVVRCWRTGSVGQEGVAILCIKVASTDTWPLNSRMVAILGVLCAVVMHLVRRDRSAARMANYTSVSRILVAIHCTVTAAAAAAFIIGGLDRLALRSAPPEALPAVRCLRHLLIRWLQTKPPFRRPP